MGERILKSVCWQIDVKRAVQQKVRWKFTTLES
ncbi:Protein of unknown function [Bacillus cytotoxicus]|uniref:Transposase n=1 Tax=Bacillus cytotoxicus TaxID=580165 RepID=A0AAX2CLV5_9BACI|nr:Protein of unknown function [Bacillus cytotoxicus]SCN41706.1 Protein of unknown function [Bacillus cytotoxicus]